MYDLTCALKVGPAFLQLLLFFLEWPETFLLRLCCLVCDFLLRSSSRCLFLLVITACLPFLGYPCLGTLISLLLVAALSPVAWVLRLQLGEH